MGSPATRHTVYADDGRPLFDANVVLVEMSARTSHARVEGLAASVGGRVIGAIPGMCLFKLEVPATTRTEQDAILARLNKAWGVKYADVDMLASMGPPECTGYRRNDAGLTPCDQQDAAVDEWWSARRDAGTAKRGDTR
jgi:hypothetical protein